MPPTVEQRLAQVRTDLINRHARVAEIDHEIHTLRERARAIAAGEAVPVGDDSFEVMPPPVPALPGAVALVPVPEGGVRLHPTAAGTDAEDFRRYELAVQTYRLEGAVSASIALGMRPLEVLPYLVTHARRWPVVDGQPVLPLVDEKRAQFLRDVAEFCSEMGGITQAATARQRPVSEVTAWIDEGVRLGVVEWPPAGDVGRAVAELMG